MLKYVIQLVEGSFCSKCSDNVHLLIPKFDPEGESFYICWNCRDIYHIGVGVIDKDGKCPCGGHFNDWHSHATDCIEINVKGKQY